MNEIGYRYAYIYWAANGGNWALAQYQLKELLEAQEVAEITRPKRAALLRGFERRYLDPLRNTIGEQDLEEFNRRFAAATDGCNVCHEKTGYGFVRYRVPPKPKDTLLDFTLQTEPSSEPMN